MPKKPMPEDNGLASGQEHVTRLDGEPVDVTLDDGRVVTIGAEPCKGRLKIKVTTPGKAKLKRRAARSDTPRQA